MKSKQLEMESIMTHQSGVFDFWAGWKWSQPKEVRPFIHGQVITPRWADQYRSTDPVMMDNGAFAAWRDGVHIEEHEHTSQLINACLKLKPRFVILPDIVGGGADSFGRTKRSASHIINATASIQQITPLVAIQEGMKLCEAVEFAENINAGIFVGGANMRWKRYAVESVRAKSESIYIHVGRIWKDGDLCWHSARVNSFDNTTFCRGQHFNLKIDKLKSLRRYCRPVIN